MIREEDLNTLKSLHENFIDGKSHDENIINCDIIEKLNCALQKLMDRLGESLCTAKLLIQYIRYIDIFHCCRKNWKLAKPPWKHSKDAEFICCHRSFKLCTECKAIFANDERIAYYIS